MDFSHRLKKRLWPQSKQTVTIDAALFTAVETALIGYQFALCTAPPHDGRHDVWLAMCAIRDKRLAVVRQALTDLHGMKGIKNHAAYQAFR